MKMTRACKYLCQLTNRFGHTFSRPHPPSILNNYSGFVRQLYSLNTRMEVARLREHATDIFNNAVKAVIPQAMVLKALQLDGNLLTVADHTYQLNHNVYVVAFGKAVIGMVKTTDEILHEHIVGGIASVPFGMQAALKSLGKWLVYNKFAICPKFDKLSFGMEAEIQLPLKKFRDSSLSSLIRAGWCEEGHPTTKNWLMAIVPLVVELTLVKSRRRFGFLS